MSSVHYDENIDLEALKLKKNKEYEKLVLRYEKPLISSIMKKINNYDEALEIVQDSFLSFYKNIDSFEGRSKVYTWLYRVAMNKSIDLLRKREREKKSVAKLRVDDVYYDSDYLENKDMSDILKEALKSLEDSFKTPIILLEFENYSYEEIARKLDIPVNTVKTRIFRGRKKLLEIVRKMGVSL